MNEFAKKEDELFDNYSDREKYGLPVWSFIFRSGNIDKHIAFLKRKVSLETFVKYLADDIKKEKKYVYKNNILKRRTDILKENFLKRPLNQTERSLTKDFATLSEILCTVLTHVLLPNSGIKNKDSFTWNTTTMGKTIGVRAN